MSKALPRVPCPRPQVVCQQCDALFLSCVCGLQHTVTYLAQCRLCRPILPLEGATRWMTVNDAADASPGTAA
jgi:hypothetical protein